MITRYDVDGNGVIDYAEFIKVGAVLGPGAGCLWRHSCLYGGVCDQGWECARKPRLASLLQHRAPGCVAAWLCELVGEPTVARAAAAAATCADAARERPAPQARVRELEARRGGAARVSGPPCLCDTTDERRRMRHSARARPRHRHTPPRGTPPPILRFFPLCMSRRALSVPPRCVLLPRLIIPVSVPTLPLPTQSRL